MDNKKDRVSKLLSFDVIIEKRKKENSEIFENDFDDNIFVTKHKKTKPKKIIFFIILLVAIIIIGLIIFIIIYLNKEKKSSCVIGEEEKCKTCKEPSNEC